MFAAPPSSDSSPTSDSAATAEPSQRTGVVKALGSAAFFIVRLTRVQVMQMQAVVVVWQVYVRQAQFLSMVLLLVPAGDLIERDNRNTI